MHTVDGLHQDRATVILTTGSTSCLSSDSKALTVSLSSADPDYFGAGAARSGLHPVVPGSCNRTVYRPGSGYFTGSAEPVSCTSDLLTLPAYHD